MKKGFCSPRFLAFSWCSDFCVFHFGFLGDLEGLGTLCLTHSIYIQKPLSIRVKRPNLKDIFCHVDKISVCVCVQSVCFFASICSLFSLLSLHTNEFFKSFFCIRVKLASYIRLFWHGFSYFIKGYSQSCHSHRIEHISVDQVVT